LLASLVARLLDAFSSSFWRPIKRGPMDIKQASNLSYRLSVLLDKLARVDDSSSIKSWSWAEAYAARFGGNPSGAGTFHDQGALEPLYRRTR
jgi:hypothetical protein